MFTYIHRYYRSHLQDLTSLFFYIDRLEPQEISLISQLFQRGIFGSMYIYIYMYMYIVHYHFHIVRSGIISFASTFWANLAANNQDIPITSTKHDCDVSITMP